MPTHCNPIKVDLDHILTHTEGLWEEMRGKRIFITGGTGFFGCWLLESFVWANDNLGLDASALVLTRDYAMFQKKAPHLGANPAIQFHIGDVRNFAFPNDEFSYIVHAATESSASLNEQNPLLMFDTIVEGTRHVLEFAHHCSAEKLLLASSGAVYGKQPPEISHLLEDYIGAPDIIDPQSAYAEGKRTAELLSTIYARQYGFEIKIARGFAFVGPYLPLDMHYAIGNFIRDGLNGGPIIVNGNGMPYRSYLYAADLAIWLWTILFKGGSCRPYNVGSEEEISISELAHTVARFGRRPIEVKIVEIPDLSRPAERYVPSTKRAREECGIRQIIDLSEGIRRTLQYNAKFQP